MDVNSLASTAVVKAPSPPPQLLQMLLNYFVDFTKWYIEVLTTAPLYAGGFIVYLILLEYALSMKIPFKWMSWLLALIIGSMTYGWVYSIIFTGGL